MVQQFMIHNLCLISKNIVHDNDRLFDYSCEQATDGQTLPRLTRERNPIETKLENNLTLTGTLILPQTALESAADLF